MASMTAAVAISMATPKPGFISVPRSAHKISSSSSIGSRPVSVKLAASRRCRTARCALPEITEANFEEEVLKSDVPVLVDFWATWCGPCRLILPIVERVAKEYDGKLKVVKIEIDKCPALVEKYKVYGLPTLIIFQDGKKIEASHTEGAVSKDKVSKLVTDLLPSLQAS